MTIVEGETNRKGGMACLETALALPTRRPPPYVSNDAVAFGVMLTCASVG